MDSNILELIAFVAAFLLWVAWVMAQNHSQDKGQLPPGPRRWPLVGNIFQLIREPPHISLTKLARQHGALMTVWLGSMCTVVISSKDVAREMFKKHDLELAGRKIYEAMKGDYTFEGSIITSQYGPHWRMLRRLCNSEFFVSNRLDATKGLRGRCVNQMLKVIQDVSAYGTKSIDIGRYFFLLSFNLFGNSMFSKDLLDTNSEMGAKFFYHTVKIAEFAGKPNVADFFPFLKNFDLQSIKSETQFHFKSLIRIVEEFIKDRMENNQDGSCDVEISKKTKDYLDVLLEFQGDGVEEPSRFSSKTINLIVFEMFTAGSETTATTLEWAMAELLHNPTKLHKLQAELRSNVGGLGKKIEENNIENLPYLKAVIKETLRLHPPLPFLIPHMARTSCKMLGYTIPKATQILVNVLAIGRDPNSWEDPLVFKPERFLDPNNQKEYKGHDFEYIPFGSGRRMCPALPFASRLLPLVLGSLLHLFDWILVDGLKPEDMDMTERMGITLRKAVPLKVIPLPYK